MSAPSIRAGRCVVCGCGDRLAQVPAFEPMIRTDVFGRRVEAPTVTLCDGCAKLLAEGLLHFRWRLNDGYTYRAMVNGTARRGHGCGRMEWLRTDEPMPQDDAARIEKGWERVMSWRER